jgi:hypothetical protein
VTESKKMRSTQRDNSFFSETGRSAGDARESSENEKDCRSMSALSGKPRSAECQAKWEVRSHFGRTTNRDRIDLITHRQQGRDFGSGSSVGQIECCHRSIIDDVKLSEQPRNESLSDSTTWGANDVERGGLVSHTMVRWPRLIVAGLSCGPHPRALP